MSSSGARETRAFAAEIKFLLPRATGASVREWARRHLDRDPHGSGPSGDEYGITTLYFDNGDYDVFHRRRSFGRSKYRIRRYDHGGSVFLERKLRMPGMLAKRRTPIAATDLPALEGTDPIQGPGGWFHRRLLLRQLRPVCEISYQRMAREAMSPWGPIRLTLDDRLHVVGAERPAFGNGDVPRVRLIEDDVILELKYRSEVPTIFKRLAEEFDLRPQPASKYRLGVAAIDPDGTGRAAARLTGDAVSGLPCA
jgi:hypothetical protein